MPLSLILRRLMVALLLTLLALAVGPLIHRLVLTRPAALELLDSFTVLAVGGLVLLQIIPGTLHEGGWAAGAAVLLGIVSPVLAEGLLHRAAEKVHRVFLALAMLGIGLHAFFDGIALASGDGDEHTSLLAMAVVIHSVPVGLMVSWLLLTSYGLRTVVGTILFMIVSTVGGFLAAAHLATHGHGGGLWLAVLQAFVAGSLVHVLIHRPRSTGKQLSGSGRWLAALAGAAVAAGVLAFLLLTHEHERAPLWLVLICAPVLAVFLFLHYAPEAWVDRIAPWRHHHDHRH